MRGDLISDGGSQAALSRRALLIGGAMGLTAAGAAIAAPRKHEAMIDRAQLSALIPNQLGEWQAQPGLIADPPEGVATTEVYDQILARGYFSPTAPPIMLLIAYGAAQSGLMKLHRPDVCYRGAGFQVRFPETTNVTLSPTVHIPARRFLAARPDRNERVLFWTRLGDAFPASLDDQRIQMLRYGLRRTIPDGVLVRISTLEPNDALAIHTTQGFAARLIDELSSQGRSLLIGRALTAQFDRP